MIYNFIFIHDNKESASVLLYIYSTNLIKNFC